jgi:hypothetical protein
VEGYWEGCNEPSGSTRCLSGCTTGGLSSSSQLNYIPEDGILRSYRREKLKPYFALSYTQPIAFSPHYHVTFTYSFDL